MVPRSNTQTEHQPYTLVQQFPGFEVRYYPEALMARVYSGATTYREITSPGFRTLAGYIFGSNDGGKKIAMTAPVHVEMHEQGTSMAFVMPAHYDMEDLPGPDNPAVKLERSQPGYVAAITFGGYASDEKITEQRDLLKEHLRKNKLKWVGNFRFLGYNSPYKVWNRRNEIVVNIIWD